MTIISYYLRDAKIGLQRNRGAAACAAALIFITMAITGTLWLIRSSTGDILHYLEHQVSMKVYMEPSVDPQEVVASMSKLSFVKSVHIETKEQLLEGLNSFFEGREHLLNAFIDSSIPDAVVLELTRIDHSDQIAQELQAIPGVIDVVYPQQLAQGIMKWSDRLNRFGVVLFICFAVIAYVTVTIATRLALFQRQKEIRVKLLLGANPAHVRGQFLFEGFLIACLASLAAAIGVNIIFTYVLKPLEHHFQIIFKADPNLIYIVMLALVLLGSVLGLSASYFATRKMMKDA